ncbi:yjeR [Wigglesworthia glossinidia endosymbiont of Glossina brevipalpis]|uniref:Oligoribonuclease n=1 Tax=Wigglesworthia glossinidia brevipalpis TaxID=36870 RepID=ORN_WIGBR|nr:RecName: Full=Oligoribonuclease [Wigglesworthia glossinidia endosymbiont of Glossina brevipalpis]BAC24575.1 yjeR [Wigglesworthia glossinidia endosymbiont of Glossina brevipalpis]
MNHTPILNKKNLIWIDLEMTGLNLENDRIIEIATVITDKYVKILAEGPSIAIFQSEEQLKKMNSWNIFTHTKNGLIDRVRKSKYNEKNAMIDTLKFISSWVPFGKSPICGSSINHDRLFLSKYMPDLEKYFHYRCLDVSVIKELARRWKPKILSKLKKKHTHKALDDIKDSIKELLFYKDTFIKLN